MQRMQMKKIVAWVLCCVLFFSFSASADVDCAASLVLNDKQYDVQVYVHPEQEEMGMSSKTPREDMQLHVTKDGVTVTEYGTTRTLANNERAGNLIVMREEAAYNDLLTYLISAEGRNELMLICSEVLERLPLLDKYVGWQEAEDGTCLMTQHTLSSMMTLLAHFVQNELLDSEMYALLNNSRLNEVLWKNIAYLRYALGLPGSLRNTAYSNFSLGSSLRMLAPGWLVDLYSSSLPAVPLTVKLYSDRLELAFSVADKNEQIEALAVLSEEGLKANVAVSYAEDFAVTDTYALELLFDDGICTLDFAMNMPSDDESMRVWGSVNFNTPTPEILLLGDFPEDETNFSLRMTQGRLYFTVFENGRYNVDVHSIICNWTDTEYTIEAAIDGSKRNVTGTYALNEGDVDYIYLTFHVDDGEKTLLEGESSLLLGPWAAIYQVAGKAYNTPEVAVEPDGGATVADASAYIDEIILKLLQEICNNSRLTEYDFDFFMSIDLK